eukprot:SAG11_NODE_11444_length_760_cov_1.261725_2_plen_53_part_01
MSFDWNGDSRPQTVRYTVGVPFELRAPQFAALVGDDGSRLVVDTVERRADSWS